MKFKYINKTKVEKNEGILYQGDEILEEKNLWISVKDELPKYKKDVLFVNGKNEVSVGQRLPYQEGTDIWSTENSIYFNDRIIEELATCKFWMELPKPPEESKQ